MQEKACVIDLGSNSLRLLIYRLNRDGSPVPLFRKLVETRLGEGLKPGTGLGGLPRQRTLDGFINLITTAKENRVKKGMVVATSAVREAADGQDFLKELSVHSPFPVRLLEEEDEAYFGFLGALKALESTGIHVKDSKEILTCDLGGRSTELSWETEGVFHWVSLPVGAVGLQERYLENFSEENLLKLCQFVQEEGRKRLRGALPALTEKRLVGLGGTVTTLAALVQGLKEYRPECCHGFFLSREEIFRWKEYLRSSSLDERLRLLPFAPQRADIIQAGSAILWAIMELLMQEKMIVSEEGLLYGAAAALEFLHTE